VDHRVHEKTLVNVTDGCESIRDSWEEIIGFAAYT
jgi:hypothetical protein